LHSANSRKTDESSCHAATPAPIRSANALGT